MKILITGGAGYLGSTLLSYLHGNDITVFDNLMHGGESLLPYFRDVNFHFVKGDIRNFAQVREACEDKDVVVHLAAIVGLPACEANRDVAKLTNYEGTHNLIRATKGLPTKIVYASTVSVYGSVPTGVCTEETPTLPLSLYGSTKLMAEQDLINYSGAVALRFPTLFGASPRMRLDLMVNELTHEAVTTGHIHVFQPEVRRPFLHVADAARAVVHVIDRWHSLSNSRVYLPGDETLNTTKADLANKICSLTGASMSIDRQRTDGDGRDYEISFEKMKSFGFHTKYSLEQGIKEIIKASKVLKVNNPYKNV